MNVEKELEEEVEEIVVEKEEGHNSIVYDEHACR